MGNKNARIDNKNFQPSGAILKEFHESTIALIRKNVRENININRRYMKIFCVLTLLGALVVFAMFVAPVPLDLGYFFPVLIVELVFFASAFVFRKSLIHWEDYLNNMDDRIQ